MSRNTLGAGRLEYRGEDAGGGHRTKGRRTHGEGETRNREGGHKTQNRGKDNTKHIEGRNRTQGRSA